MENDWPAGVGRLVALLKDLNTITQEAKSNVAPTLKVFSTSIYTINDDVLLAQVLIALGVKYVLDDTFALLIFMSIAHKFCHFRIKIQSLKLVCERDVVVLSYRFAVKVVARPSAHLTVGISLISTSKCQTVDAAAIMPSTQYAR